MSFTAVRELYIVKHLCLFFPPFLSAESSFDMYHLFLLTRPVFATSSPCQPSRGTQCILLYGWWWWGRGVTRRQHTGKPILPVGDNLQKQQCLWGLSRKTRLILSYDMMDMMNMRRLVWLHTECKWHWVECDTMTRFHSVCVILQICGSCWSKTAHTSRERKTETHTHP